MHDDAHPRSCCEGITTAAEYLGSLGKSHSVPGVFMSGAIVKHKTPDHTVQSFGIVYDQKI